MKVIVEVAIFEGYTSSVVLQRYEAVQLTGRWKIVEYGHSKDKTLYVEVYKPRKSIFSNKRTPQWVSEHEIILTIEHDIQTCANCQEE